MSNLVDHARKELKLLGEDPETSEQIVRIVQAFADMGHSGFSAMHTVGVLDRLLTYRNLTPLTNDPEEWNYIPEDMSGEAGGLWQNKRNSEAFSHDGGFSYYLLSEEHSDVPRILHMAEVKVS